MTRSGHKPDQLTVITFIQLMIISSGMIRYECLQYLLPFSAALIPISLSRTGEPIDLKMLPGKRWSHPPEDLEKVLTQIGNPIRDFIPMQSQPGRINNR